MVWTSSSSPQVTPLADYLGGFLLQIVVYLGSFLLQIVDYLGGFLLQIVDYLGSFLLQIVDYLGGFLLQIVDYLLQILSSNERRVKFLSEEVEAKPVLLLGCGIAGMPPYSFLCYKNSKSVCSFARAVRR